MHCDRASRRSFAHRAHRSRTSNALHIALVLGSRAASVPKLLRMRRSRKNTPKRNHVELFLVIRGPIHAAVAAVLLCAALIATSACSHHISARTPNGAARPAKIGSTQTGIASWYGEPYNGRRTASGEIFDMQQLVAAHRTLPFQTWVEVTDLDNGKKVEVRIIDRGPYVDGRIIDLSYGAAREIEMVRPGLARVKLKVIKPPKTNATKRNAAPDPKEAAPAPISSDRRTGN